MTDTRFENVWDAIEDTRIEAENMRLRSVLMMAIRDYIESEGLTQKNAATLMGVTQPRISDLCRGKIHLFGLDSLVGMVSATGLRVEISVTEAA